MARGIARVVLCANGCHFCAGDIGDFDYRVARGAVAVIIHAMKMEHAITVPRGGKVREVAVRIGDQVSVGNALVALDPDDVPA